MSVSISLVSVNVEGERHLDLVVPFLKKLGPEVVCMQELFEADIPALEAVLGPCFFVPMMLHKSVRGLLPWGIGIFSRLPLVRSFSLQYAGREEDSLAPFDTTSLFTRYHTQKYPLVVVKIGKEGSEFTVATSHFPWTPDGRPNDFQRESLGALFAALDGIGEFVLCGDFNAPRGMEIFDTIAGRYKDTIPSEYKTSLDGSLHRVGLEAFKKEGMDTFMVDGLFSTPEYDVREVSLVSGVSDHCAIVATVCR